MSPYSSNQNQSFSSSTLEVLYNISGVPYTSVERAESRTQIDARSISSKWTTPINYYISKTTGLTPIMISTSKEKNKQTKDFYLIRFFVCI